MNSQHEHKYDAQGNQMCCLQSDKIYKKAGISQFLYPSKNNYCCSSNTSPEEDALDHSHGHSHNHYEDLSFIQAFGPSILSLTFLMLAFIIDKYVNPGWLNLWTRFLLYALAYIPVGVPVIQEAIFAIKQKNIFSEFFLMSIATLGAFALQEYPEAVAVMLFYSVGESLQTLAVSKVKHNIKALLDHRPDHVNIIGENNKPYTIHAQEAKIGDIIQLKPGEQLALDGELLSNSASFNTVALTGESKPKTFKAHSSVLAGMINLNTLAKVKVTTSYKESRISKILDLVQNAAKQKAPTELFIQKFAKIYTPIVVYSAIALTFLPYLFVQDYIFADWLHRALVFLVISCPCALVISVPLGYLGGIGAASTNGILFKGGNFLDTMSNIEHIVFDKTGTVTHGDFKVQDFVLHKQLSAKEKNTIFDLVYTLESNSTHPIATAITTYLNKNTFKKSIKNITEIPGMGLKSKFNRKEILIGNLSLLKKYDIQIPNLKISPEDTIVAVSYGKNFIGHFIISDTVKTDAKQVIETLQNMNINLTMLSGDTPSITNQLAKKLGIQNAHGGLLPEDKFKIVQQLQAEGETVAFVGDGLNDGPVIAVSHVGIAMGQIGSDSVIEVADIVIQNDELDRLPMAIRIGQQTKKIIWQNISLAFGIKLIVLFLGAGAMATMWHAVFADVGVALIAIGNSIRIQKMAFNNK